VVFGAVAPAAADGPRPAQPSLAQAAPSVATAAFQGTVRSAGGAPIAGATVVATAGTTRAVAATDANGAFSLSVPAGVYRLDVTAPGYLPATLNDVAVTAGSSTPLTVTMNQPNLTSLQTIGRVSTAVRGSGSAINTGAASSTFVGAQTFANLANPQINDVLQHIPDVNIERMGSQPDTTIVLAGSQPYETQVLMDGHPIALGQYGVWSSQFFPSWLVGGAESQVGPGNTTPFANIAVAGTVNLLTPGFTRTPTSEAVYGVDSYGSQYSHVLVTGNAGKLSYVAGAGYGSVNGPYFQTQRCAVTPDLSANDNTPASNGIVQFCGDTSGSLFQKGEILKLRYAFSPSSSLELGFVGAWGGFLPQGASYGTYLGQTLVDNCLPSAPVICTNPANANLIGKTIPAYAWYPGSNVYFNQPMFDAEWRQQIGKATLLLRPYAGSFQPDVVDGSGEAYFPAFFGANPAAYGPTYAADFSAACNTLFSQPTNGSGRTNVVNGQQECFQGPFSELEEDKLYGGTAALLMPVGANLFSLNYDYHATDVFAYYNSPTNIAVPDSTQRYTTFSLTGDIRAVRNVGIQVGLYDTTWKLIGSQSVLQSGNAVLVPLQRSINRFDPHLALTFRPANDVSYRIAAGSSETFPTPGQVTGSPFYQPPSASTNNNAFLLEKNPFLDPEQSFTYTLGADKRFRNGSVLALDLTDMTIHNVFEPLTIAGPPGSSGISGGTLFTTSPINASRERAQLATLKYTYAPRTGLGYNLAATAERAVIDGIPPSVFSTDPTQPTVPANGVQICGNGLANPNNPICIPYLKAYAQVTYTARDGTFAGLGADFQGKNNAYYQPPFALLDLTVRRPVTPSVEVQMVVENLLNERTNGNQYLPAPNLGTAITGDYVDAFNRVQQSAYVPSLIPALPRTVRVQVRIHHGR
jgi:hypothetical protein